MFNFYHLLMSIFIIAIHHLIGMKHPGKKLYLLFSSFLVSLPFPFLQNTEKLEQLSRYYMFFELKSQIRFTHFAAILTMLSLALLDLASSCTGLKMNPIQRLRHMTSIISKCIPMYLFNWCIRQSSWAIKVQIPICITQSHQTRLHHSQQPKSWTLQ